MPEVRDTPDYRRVRDLPRRRPDMVDGAEWAADLTPMLRAPGGTRVLQPEQAYALVEVHQNRGGFLGLPVGFGKTDITYTLPTILRSSAPLLIVPGAGLRDKTAHEFNGLRREWREPPPMKIVAWQELVTDAAAQMIANMRPDLIM